ncbi:tetratricopeptide repeat protein [Nocardiopsis potens]|uniref:tetratricopeptide repeat protein n=1 Tax=Nocardiopsis potens TaxID=1246458 RepID=UPI000372BF41|nr:hypothetical protein [Nocardiopsis potens]
MTPTPPAPAEAAGSLLARLRIRMDLEGAPLPEESRAVFAEARRLYDEAERSPGDPEAPATIAIGRAFLALLELRAYAEASPWSEWYDDETGPALDEAEEDDEENGGAGRPLAEEAARAAREAFDADPADPLVPFCLGLALKWLGDGEGARAAFFEAVQRDPGDFEALAHLHELGGEPAAPDGAPAARWHAFVLVTERVRITNSDWATVVTAYGSPAAARTAVDAALDTYFQDDIGDDRLGDFFQVRLEVHVPPGPGEAAPDRRGTALDPTPHIRGSGKGFSVDWAAVGLPDRLEAPLPPGRPVRMGGGICFPGPILPG